MRAGLIYLSIVFILSLLGFSIQRRTTRHKPFLKSKELVIKSHGALELDFEHANTRRESQLITVPGAEQNLLLMNLKSGTQGQKKSEVIKINLTLPINNLGGLPEPGEYLYYNKVENDLNGSFSYTVSQNKEQVRSDYHFRLKTLILRVEESDEDGLSANILMTADQVAGFQRACGKSEETELGNEGHVQIQACFKAPVYNQVTLQKSELI